MERVLRVDQKVNPAVVGLLPAVLVPDGQPVVGLVPEDPDLDLENTPPVPAITNSWTTKQKHKAENHLVAEVEVDGVEAGCAQSQRLALPSLLPRK